MSHPTANHPTQPSNSLIPYLAVALLLLAQGAGLGAAEAEPAGRVTKVRGEVSLERGAAPARALAAQDPLFAGDRLRTGEKGLVVARLADDSKLVLGDRSELVVEEVTHGQGAPRDRVAVEVAKGALRFVSGLVSKTRPEATEVRLGKLATIGFRGTNVAAEIGESGARVLLMEPEEGPGHPTAIRVSNPQGSVLLDRPGLGTTIRDAASAPTPPKRWKAENVGSLLDRIGESNGD